MSTSRRPYFMPLFVGGASVGFAHLEPFQLSMTTQARPEGLVLDVRFSNHCFSEAYDPALHQSSVDVWDRGVRRVFCPVRYQFSKALPNIVQGLPQAHVFMTPESNYVRISTRNDGGTGEYRMFFNVKRAAMGQGHDIKLFVESAYAPEPNQALSPGQMTRVRFAVLIDKTIKGERVKFHHKRQGAPEGAPRSLGYRLAISLTRGPLARRGTAVGPEEPQPISRSRGTYTSRRRQNQATPGRVCHRVSQ